VAVVEAFVVVADVVEVSADVVLDRSVIVVGG
jgi:hypothetical protein